MVNVVGAADNY